MKRLPKVYASLVAAVLVLAASQSARASSGPKWSDEQLVDFSAAIVTGRVTAIASQSDQLVRSIYTYVTVEVDDVLKGDIDGQQIVLKQAGGIVGELGMSIAGQAEFEINERVLLFAEVRPRDRTLYTTALWQGKWTIETDAVTGQRAAVRHDPDSDDVDTRSLDMMLGTIAARAAQDPRTESFDAIPDETPDSGTNPFVLLDTPARWDTQPVLVDIRAGGQPGVSSNGATQFGNVFGMWNNAGAAFTWQVRSTSAASRCGTVYAASGVVTFVPNDPCAEISNSGGTLAVAYSWFTTAPGTTVNGVTFRRMLEVIVVSNDGTTAQNFITNSNCFQQVMLHEFGHALGLGHSASSGAVMFATVSFSQCSASSLPLQGDDIDGVRFIYPSTSTPGGVPGTPTNVNANVNGPVLNVSWNAPGGSPVPTAYRLDFYSGATVVASVTVGPQTSTAIGIPPGTVGTFSVRVTAIAGNTPGSPSAPATFTIGGPPGPGPCTGPPPTPTGLNGQVAGGVASVSFNPSPGATSYIVQAGTAFGLSNLFNANIGNTTSASAPVPPGFQAYVRVIAVNACGNSAPTADFVLGLTLGFGDIQVTLSWNSTADIDLHVVEPNGTHVYFARTNGTTARLDRDDTDGFGPENIFVNRGAGAAGTYQFFIVHWAGPPTTSSIQVRVNAGLPNETFAVYSRSTSTPNTGLGINVADVQTNGSIAERTGTRSVPADEREGAVTSKGKQ